MRAGTARTAHPPTVAFTVKDHGAAGGQVGVALGARLRRLTPRECERLQGLPDDFTAVPWRGRRVAKDGPRYRAIGNGMAIPVMRWILTRLRREHER